MKLTTIPDATLEANLKAEKKLLKERNVITWWRVSAADMPTHAILARSTGGGVIKPGVTVYLIAGHDREVFLGKDMDKFKIHEYVGLVENTGWQPLVQLGRDIEFVQPNQTNE